MILHAVKATDDGLVARTQAGKLSLLRDEWSKKFALRNLPRDVPEAFAHRWAQLMDFSTSAPPSVDDFEEYLTRLSDSAPGIDGLPYSAWASAGRDAAITLSGVEQVLREGIMMPYPFNDVLQVFLPKGDKEGDE
eukprot:9401082-Heterocapsa_arctica.AAC.1